MISEHSMGCRSDSQAINSQSSDVFNSQQSDVFMQIASQLDSSTRPGRDGGSKGGAEGCGGGGGEGGGEGGVEGGAEGVVGEGGSGWCVMVVDTKTRVRPRTPRTAQSRNSRWAQPFFSSFRLQPHTALSPQVLEHAAELFPQRKVCEGTEGVVLFAPASSLCTSCVCSPVPHYQIACLADVTAAVSHAFQSLQPMHSTLLLRYEWQADGSLIHEDRFPYDSHWLQASISASLDFWLGRRPAFIVPREEAWKCFWCSFAPVCRPDLRWKGQAGNGACV
ncbi:unnamed protein product [Closterium sp. NIES-53]